MGDGGIEQEPIDDWADQDLLTKDEAHRRLGDEIQSVRDQLGALSEGSPDDPAVLLLSKRLAAMESMYAEYAADLSPQVGKPSP